MKQVVSLSLGSDRRDASVIASFLGEEVRIERQGVNGDERRFMARLRELDGTVDAIGFGGMDRYIWSAGRRYEFRAARRLLTVATKTPVVDGSGLKNTLEREAVHFLAANRIVDFARSRVLMVCGVDRFGMSEALVQQQGEVVFGDLMFALGIPYAIGAWRQHRRLARLLLPVLTRLPLSVLYPTGERQNDIAPRWERWYQWADIVAGDFLYIRKHLPPPDSEALRGKVILTNTTTRQDVEELSARGVRLLITTTPVFGGRSFGANVMEAVCVALNGGRTLSPEEYTTVLKRLGWTPEVRVLQRTAV